MRREISKRTNDATRWEFKQQAVRLILGKEKSVSAVAREFDLTSTALRQWVKHARADRTKGKTELTTILPQSTPALLGGVA
jgi:transposase-like protein